MTTLPPSFAVGALVLVLLAGCGGAQPAPSADGSPSADPSPSPSPSGTVSPSADPSPSGDASPSPGQTGGSLTVTSHAQAAALVLASDDRFVGIGPQQFDVIGQCCWYEPIEAADGWQINVVIGSGDCMAGCIDRQTWQFHVDTDGRIELIGEEGSAELPFDDGSGPSTATIQAVAGPSCPVITDPPDPACVPRPVVGAEIVVRAPDGTELARGTTDQDGRFPVTAPAGTYWLEPQPVEGLMGTAAGIAFRLGGGDQSMYTIYYDTGIR